MGIFHSFLYVYQILPEGIVDFDHVSGYRRAMLASCPVAEEFSANGSLAVAEQRFRLRELGEKVLPDGRTPQNPRCWKYLGKLRDDIYPIHSFMGKLKLISIQ